MFQPVIKWSGSKRSQCEEILKYFPNNIDTYYEPFVGGGSVMRKLLEHVNNPISVKRIVCSDLNQDLIDLWNCIKEKPVVVWQHYKDLWNELNKDNDIERKKHYFEEIRARYNKERNPLDFMFINRTSYNGLIRYNKKGDFNVSYHINRNGIDPSKFDLIIYEWSALLKAHNVEFVCNSFEEIKPTGNDFCYLDPPYANTKGMYFGDFDNIKLFEWLRSISCSWVMSYDGISGNIDNTFDVPTDLYDEHLGIKSGNSSFKRVIGTSNDSIVYESLYIKK